MMTTDPNIPLPTVDDTANLAAFFKATVVGRDLDEGQRACVEVIVTANPLAWARATGQAPEDADAATWTAWLAARGTPATTATQINGRHAPGNINLEPRQ